MEGNLGRLGHKPALILWGDRDTAFRVAERERFERLFPDHRKRILNGARHFVQEDAPEQICDEVSAFYDQHLLGENEDGMRPPTPERADRCAAREVIALLKN